MTIRVTKTVTKLIAFCLTAALLWGTAGGYKAFLGPGLTDAATAAIDLGTLTPTDIVPIEQPLEPMAVTTKVQNIRVVITVTRGDINTATAELSAATSGLSLVQYDTGSLSATSFNGCVTDYWNIDKTFYIGILSSHNFAANTRLMNLYLDAPTSMSNPLNGISLAKGAIFSDSYASIPDGLSLTKVVLGDVNQDGVVDATDSLLALQFATGTVSLTESQQLAADVDLSGTVDATDGMKINQYAVSNILSFYANKMVEIPTEVTAAITDGNYYRIQNVATSQYISFDDDNNSVKVISSSAYDSTSTDCKFKLQKASASYPIYTITRPGSSDFLALDADRNLTFNAAGRLSGSQFWYVFPYGTGYLIVNQKETQQPLRAFSGDDLGIAALHTNQVWLLHGPNVVLKYNYNYGYRFRMGGDAAASAELTARQAEIATIIQNVFGATVQTETVARFISREDLCYTPTSTPTVAQVIAAIGADDVADYDPTTNPHPCPDNHCTDAVCEDKDEANTHHRSASAGLDYYRSYQPASNAHKIVLLTSGYEPCYVRDHDNDGVETHGFGTIAGLANSYRRVAGVYHGDSENTYKNTIVALHEIAHCLGATSIYGATVDADHSQTGTNGDCIMSYTSNDADSSMLYHDVDPNTAKQSHEALFCSSCRNAIRNHLNNCF